ncbi:stalk domain-containing protein [Paenibacillus sp. GYB004]
MVPHRIWIPLRMTAEASGLAVEWSPYDRMVTVGDPNERFHFNVTTRADVSTSKPPDCFKRK